MSWNGEIVIDLDSHVVERADRFYQDYIDPAYREAYRQPCDGVAQQAKAGPPVLALRQPHVRHRADRDGPPARHPATPCGLTAGRRCAGGRKAFPPGRADALPPIRPRRAGT